MLFSISPPNCGPFGKAQVLLQQYCINGTFRLTFEQNFSCKILLALDAVALDLLFKLRIEFISNFMRSKKKSVSATV